MQLYLFQSGAEAGVFGFTADATGANLPEGFRPWQRFGNALDVDGGDAVTSGDAANVIIDGVQRNGFYLARGGVKIAGDAVP